MNKKTISKYAQFCAMKTMNELKASLMLYLSGGSKELFHSNFLYWLGINYRQVFEQLMSRMLGISGVWPQGWTVKREYYHLNLCVTYSKDTGKTHKGCPVVREYAFSEGRFHSGFLRLSRSQAIATDFHWLRYESCRRTVRFKS